MLLRGYPHVGHLARNLAGCVAALKAQCRILMAGKAHWETLILITHVLLLLLLLYVELLTKLLLPTLSFASHQLCFVEHPRVFHKARRQSSTTFQLRLSSLLMLHLIKHRHWWGLTRR
jgi:hypothetical protein